ncbi:hypothetical protein LOTGIDRAFT_173975 [Lottia gigantea]|uniref:Apple domain-containing protein n=1 Tax=Lottia gigantea TaxID=225164 RepID=V4AZ96_LOTGI|nr:hypothetical protein LOTGIDRAFT_173975 [Lottia gigantea]ESO99046.1 hypothetical protein LOTGIDRAFT_173975 [Lottia gigantea]
MLARVRKLTQREIRRMKGYFGIVLFSLLIDNISCSPPCEPSVTRYRELDRQFNENVTPIQSSTTKAAIICSRKCRESSDPRCMSFNFNTRTKECLLYSSPLDPIITNYVEKPGSQNWQVSFNCQEKEELEPRDLTTEKILPLTEQDITLSPTVITSGILSSTTEYISTMEPDNDCVPGWGLLYPVLIACSVITIIILITIAACCIHKHCEKKRKQGYRPFQPSPSRTS